MPPSRKRKNQAEDPTRTRQPPTGRSTRRKAADGPRFAVFQTAELLEAILIYLDINLLFVCQRVCKQFRDCIADSVILQRKLGLRADAEEERWVVRRSWYDEIDGLEKPVHHKAFFTRGEDGVVQRFEKNDVHATAGNIKPSFTVMPVRPSLLLDLSEMWSQKNSAMRMENNYALEHTSDQVDFLFPTGSLDERHSWHDVYVTNPPAKVAYIDVCFKIKSYQVQVHVRRERIECESGLTFGVIMDAILHRRWPDTSGWQDHVHTGGEKGTFEREDFLEVLRRLEKKQKRKPVLMHARLQFEDAVVASEAEWNAMRMGDSTEELVKALGDYDGREELYPGPYS